MRSQVERSLEIVGNKNLYQYLLIGFLSLVSAQIHFLILGPTFVFMNPIFQCTFIGGIVNESIACTNIKKCRILNDFTLVAYAELYCDRQVSRNIIQSSLAIGSIAGLFIMSVISDRKGHKYSFVLSLYLSVIGFCLCIVGGFYKSVILMAISQIICGFSGCSQLMLVYILPYDFCEEQFRQILYARINYAWSLSIVLLGVFYFIYNIWYNLLIIVFLIPTIGILLIAIFFLIESPNFLFKEKRIPECLESLKLLALYNQTLQNFDQVKLIINSQHSQQMEDEKQYPLKQVLRQWKFVKLILILTLVQIGINVYLYGSNYAIEDLGYGYGYNLITFGAVQIISDIFMSIFITKLPKRNSVIVFELIASLLGLLFLFQSVQKSQLYSLSILVVTHFFSTTSFVLMMIMLTNSFPKNVQSTCYGLIQGLSELGGFLAPIIVTMSINFQINPYILLSIFLLVFSVFPMLFMKQDQKKLDKLIDQQIYDTKEIKN